MKPTDRITARDLASDIGVDLPTLLAWLRRNGHAAVNGHYMLGAWSEAHVREHVDELAEQDADRRANDPRRMPPRPGRTISDDNPFRSRRR